MGLQSDFWFPNLKMSMMCPKGPISGPRVEVGVELVRSSGLSFFKNLFIWMFSLFFTRFGFSLLLCACLREIRLKITWCIKIRIDFRFIFIQISIRFWCSFSKLGSARVFCNFCPRALIFQLESSYINAPDSKVHGPTWDPPGSCRPQVDPM